MVGEEKGCAACVDTCPWHVLGAPEGGPMVKCTLCEGRGAANGEIPECVKACRQVALKLVLAEEASESFNKSGLKNILLGQA